MTGIRRPAPRAAEDEGERLVRVRGLTFRLRSTVPERADDGVAVLLVHGIGMSHRTMRDVQVLLARTVPVHAVDLPGFGGCPAPPRTVPVGEMAEALGEVCDAAGLHTLVVVGHSMGAQWALELAIRRPELVVGGVLLGPVADRDHRTIARQALALAVDVVHEPLRTTLLAVADYVRASSRWYVSQVRHMVAYPIDERIVRTRVPVLIVRGGVDTVSGLTWCRALRDRAPDAELVVVPSGAHNVQVSRPRAVAGAIEDFLRRRVAARLSPG